MGNNIIYKLYFQWNTSTFVQFNLLRLLGFKKKKKKNFRLYFSNIFLTLWEFSSSSIECTFFGRTFKRPLMKNVVSLFP